MKSSRGSTTQMEVTVGVFMFLALLVLIATTILLSTQNIFKTYYPIEVRFERVFGLRNGANVLVRGLQVGKVDELKLREDGVYVTLKLNQPVSLRDDYKIEIVPSSALGGKHVQIFEGSREANVIPDGTTVLGETPIDLMAEASDAISALRRALTEGGVLDNLESTMEDFKKVTSRLSAGEGTLGKLLMEDGIYKDLEKISKDLQVVSDNLANGEGTIGKLLTDDAVYNDLKVVSTNLRVISEQVVNGEGTLGKLINDDTIYNDLSTVTTNLSVVSTRLVNGEGTLGKLLSKEDEMYDDLADAVAAIKEIAESINSGEGTLGKLTKDDEMYLEVMRLLNEVRATVDDFRETAPITSFTSVFFGAF